VLSTIQAFAHGYVLLTDRAGAVGRGGVGESRIDRLARYPHGMSEERAVPKPTPQKPIVANPSTLGIQPQQKRPGGRDAPPDGERR